MRILASDINRGGGGGMLGGGPGACSPEKNVDIWASSEARIRVQTDIIKLF